MNRKSLTKKTRFEVFKRDSFTCQYCGRCAPAVILQADHIDPVAKGGLNDLVNLITACVECNAGKSDRKLSDDSVVQRQQAQLSQLNERREQIEMMVKWREGLQNLDEQSVQAVASAWSRRVPGYRLNEVGLSETKKHIKKFGLARVLEAVDTVATQYIELVDGTPTHESVERAWSKVGGCCALAEMPPDERELYYVRGILRNRLSYINFDMAIRLLRDALASGANVPYLKRLATECRNWTQWSAWMDYHIKELNFEHWWQTDEGTLQEGKRLGIDARPGEEMEEYRARIRRAKGEE